MTEIAETQGDSFVSSVDVNEFFLGRVAPRSEAWLIPFCSGACGYFLGRVSKTLVAQAMALLWVQKIARSSQGEWVVSAFLLGRV